MTDPQTLDALMAGKVPGSVRVRRTTWTTSEWFTPYFMTKHLAWHGLDEHGGGYADGTEAKDWLIIPKTRTVKLYGAVIRDCEGGLHMSRDLYETLDEAKKSWHSEPGASICIALTDQPLATVEVEE